MLEPVALEQRPFNIYVNESETCASVPPTLDETPRCDMCPAAASCPLALRSFSRLIKRPAGALRGPLAMATGSLTAWPRRVASASHASTSFYRNRILEAYADKPTTRLTLRQLVRLSFYTLRPVSWLRMPCPTLPTGILWPRDERGAPHQGARWP